MVSVCWHLFFAWVRDDDAQKVGMVGSIRVGLAAA